MYNKLVIKINAKRFSGFDKTKGLIGADEPYPVFFKTRFGIHTFGLKFPIDILILDNEKRVVKIKENLAPNRIFLWNPKYKSVLELPAGEVKKLKIKIKDDISFEFLNTQL